MCESVLVIGLGEVGRSIYELLQESGKFSVYGYDIDEKKMQKLGVPELPKKVDIMHICYPCTNKRKFIEITIDYVNRFRPELTIIESTVPPGTTWNIYETIKRPIAHSPVRGIHIDVKFMKQELKSWTKYVGGVNSESADRARVHFEKLGLKVKVLRGPFETELAKLFNTTYRALMIAWFQEMHRISRAFEADFDQIVDFIEDTHRVRLDRPIFFPSIIGGHCLIPNAYLLMDVYKSKFIELILESNERREKEIKEPEILMEVEKIRRRVEKLNRDLKIRGAAFKPSA